ncbi:MAG: ATP phosphoribosyltransferase [Lachnospiraceae bacterium]|nr:ATP phosphoribosyltransferase [Lachnospiraceae bacterium]
MSEQWLNIALPKGRLGEEAARILEQAGFGCPKLRDNGRKLVLENPENRVRCFWVKPADTAIYVERGAADLGIVGSDILTECEPEVYELADLGIGLCAMCAAGPADWTDRQDRPLRVATKFPRTARAYFAKQGRDIDVIRLSGSIELAPILGLSDVIVDIVETGKTLKENGLVPLETIMPVSARLIANKVSYKFAYERVTALGNAVAAACGRREAG